MNRQQSVEGFTSEMAFELADIVSTNHKVNVDILRKQWLTARL